MSGLLADVPEGSVAAAAVKVAVMAALMVPWLKLAGWVYRDARRTELLRGVWSAAAVGGGLVGMVLWLLVPFYVVGVLFYIVLAGGAFVAYAAFRNARAEPGERLSLSKALGGLTGRSSRGRPQVVAKVRLYDSAEHLVYPPDFLKATPADVQVYNDVQELLFDVAWRRASEADIVPAGQQARVVYVIDGVTAEQPALPLARGEAIVEFLKAPAGMDAAERRRPQKGKVSIDIGETKVDMQLLTAGTTGGQRLQIRVLQEVARTKLDDLGMPQDMMDWVRAFAAEPRGMLIVSGPPGSGVTSTTYSVLRLYDAFLNHVVAVERQRALDLENVTQQPYEDAKLPRIMEAIIERGLDVLMLDNCPDADTARQIIALSAAKPVILGVQASESFVALARWVKTAGDAAAAVANLRGVLCQMLLRKLCPDCRQPYKPDRQRLAKLNIPAGQVAVFYSPRTKPELDKRGQPIICPTCQGTGYRDRTAAFELLELNDEVRQLIVSGATVAQIRAACRKNKMLYLQEQALRKVIEGTTSIQEVVRITQQAQPKQQAPARRHA